MKNNIIILLALGVILITFNSCDKFLDVKPIGKIIPETIEDYSKLLYNPSLQSTSDYVFYMDDDYEYAVPTALSIIYQNAYMWKDYMLEPSEINFSWNAQYKSIYIANMVLHYIDNASGSNEVLRNQSKGEALIQRAFHHFLLVNMFGKHYNEATAASDLGIPLVTSHSFEQQLPRSTVKDVYDKILEDIDLAKGLFSKSIPDGFPTSNLQPALAATYALEAKVYFYMQKYDKAIESAQLSLNEYKELIDLNDISAEDIYPRYGNQNKEIVLNKYTIGSRPYYMLHIIYLTDDLNALFDPASDLRYQIFTSENDRNGNPLPKRRYLGEDIIFQVRSGLSIPETYLILAESYARTDDKNQALKFLNELRIKRYSSGTPEFNCNTTNEALTEILNERRRELMFTGNRFFDQKRLITIGDYTKTNTRIVDNETYILEPSSPRYVLAIPRIIMNQNNLLVQNER